MTNAELAQAVGRMEGKIDLLLSAGHEKRISSLERSRAWVIGAASVISVAIGALFHMMKGGS